MLDGKGLDSSEPMQEEGGGEEVPNQTSLQQRLWPAGQSQGRRHAMDPSRAKTTQAHGGKDPTGRPQVCGEKKSNRWGVVRPKFGGWTSTKRRARRGVLQQVYSAFPNLQAEYELQMGTCGHFFRS